jgi:hypothetical protein
MTDAIKKAFDFAQDTTKQLITIATAIIALTITFAKDFVVNVEPSIKVYAFYSWVALLASVFFGLWTLLALTGTLEPAPNKPVPQSTRGSNVKAPSVLQIFTFLAGLILATVFGWKTASSSQAVWETTTAVEKVLSAMPTIAGEKDSKWMLQALNWDATSKIYKLRVVEEKSSKTFSITADAVQGKIITVERP